MSAATLLAPTAAQLDEAPFDSALCRDVLAYYLAARGNALVLPHAAFDPMRLAPLLPNLLIFEIQALDLHRVRLAGTAYRQWFGRDLTGLNWLDVSHPQDREARQRRVLATALQPCGLRTRIWQFRQGLPRRQFEGITLPMAPRQVDGPPVMLLAMTPLDRDAGDTPNLLDLDALRRVDWAFFDLGGGVPFDDGL